MEMDGLGVREHPQCQVVGLEGSSLSFGKNILTLTETGSKNTPDFSCMLETNRPTQNDRNDRGIMSGVW